MHMADALIAPAVAGTMYLCSGTAMGYSIKKVRQLGEPEKIPVMGVMGAFVFAAQMINFTIPGTGSSGHLCGGMLLSAILGPEAGFLTMIGVLLIQSLLFADGGVLALGANIWNMAFYGCFLGGGLIWKWMMKKGMSKKKIAAASVIGCILTLQLGAFSVTLETLFSGITSLPFFVFLAAMQPIHLAIGLVEGVITAAVLVFIYEVRPEMLWGYAKDSESGKLSRKKTLAVLAFLALVIGGALSLAASAYPDGLEWSMEKIAGTAELEATGKIYDRAEGLQETVALLPDYQFRGNESAAGTSFSGIIGGLTVTAVCMLGCYALKLFGKRKAVDIKPEKGKDGHG
ncbi:MAG: energy-coupling factor ABC transporter permease [Roseburia sp.]|nr:energy-coupling factor ABC transporter permease [Roseburia sp.]MCM1278707.1 energy-coupling factor ABC transporter permease [Robinsoniella sp.]